MKGARRTSSRRVTAFFERFLQDDTAQQPYLTGELPFPGEPEGVVTSSFTPGA
ncbi:hypothetical protein ACFU7T_04095 [Streptomyces sp. NPDC057555]|uniref:hypothetical protein n=1 Tax=Streptomyces sp. NPDC057555 TaxID=3346166 RepID=UPI00368068FB